MAIALTQGLHNVSILDKFMLDRCLPSICDFSVLYFAYVPLHVTCDVDEVDSVYGTSLFMD